jgi:hypothetical protein
VADALASSADSSALQLVQALPNLSFLRTVSVEAKRRMHGLVTVLWRLSTKSDMHARHVNLNDIMILIREQMARVVQCNAAQGVCKCM